jgi:hypothetical protein
LKLCDIAHRQIFPVFPLFGQGGGSYPFRTGICTVRMAIDHIVSAIEASKTQEGEEDKH